MTTALDRTRRTLDQPPVAVIPGQLDLTRRDLMIQQPVRVQRRRTKGWRKPKNTVIVTRPSRFGNPFTLAGAIEWLGAETPEQARESCHMAFRSWVRGSDQWWMGEKAAATRRRLLDALPELRGKNLACYCPLPEPGQTDYCHAAVLLELANAPTTP